MDVPLVPSEARKSALGHRRRVGRGTSGSRDVQRFDGDERVPGACGFHMPAERAEEGLKAGVPELRRAANRLAELLEGAVY